MVAVWRADLLRGLCLDGSTASRSHNTVGDLDTLGLKDVRRQGEIATDDGDAVMRHDLGVDTDVLASDLSGRGVLHVHRIVPLADVRDRGRNTVGGSCLDAVQTV